MPWKESSVLALRLSAGHVKPDEALRVAEALADAIKMSVEATALFHV